MPKPEATRLLVVLDVDSTLIDQEAIELLAAEAGSEAEVARITEAAMRGELDFAQSLHARVATLAGLRTDALPRIAERLTPTRGAEALVAGVQAAGGAVAVVSGGFHELLDPLAGRLGLDAWRANRLEAEGGVLTGRVRGDVVDASTKAAALAGWREARGLPASRTVAVGDGANDLVMLEAAGLGVAFCAKPVVRERADVVLETRDLQLLLPLLGLPGQPGLLADR